MPAKTRPLGRPVHDVVPQVLDVDLDRAERPMGGVAFAALYDEHWRRLVGLVRTFVQDNDLVDDIAQETFLRAYHAELHLESQVDGARSPWPWLAAVARNLSLDMLRRRRYASEEELDLEMIDAEVVLDDPEICYQASLRRDAIAEAFDTLCERQRRVLLMKGLEGADIRDLAEDEGLTIEALKSVLARARRTFRTAYSSIAEHHGLTAAFGGLLAGVHARMQAARHRLAAAAPDAVSSVTAASSSAANTLLSVSAVGAVGAFSVLAPSAPAVDSPAWSPHPVAVIATVPIVVTTTSDYPAAHPVPAGAASGSTVVTRDGEPETGSQDGAAEATSGGESGGASVRARVALDGNDDGVDNVTLYVDAATGNDGSDLVVKLAVDTDDDGSDNLAAGVSTHVDCSSPGDSSTLGDAACFAHHPMGGSLSFG